MKNYSSSAILTLNLICIIVTIYALNICIYTIYWPCYTIDVCVSWLLGWNHLTLALFILLSSSTYRRFKTYNCFQCAEELIEKCATKQKISRLRFRYYYVSLIFVFIIKSTIHFFNQKYTIEFILYSLSIIVPFSMEFVFLILCSIVKDTCEEIRHSIQKLSTSNSILLAWKLQHIQSDHLKAVSLLRMVSSCFEVDLLVDLVFNLVWFIITVYQSFIQIFYKEKSNLPDNGYSLCAEMLFLGARVFYLSFSVSQIAKEVFFHCTTQSHTE